MFLSGLMNGIIVGPPNVTLLEKTLSLSLYFGAIPQEPGYLLPIPPISSAGASSQWPAGGNRRSLKWQQSIGEALRMGHLSLWDITYRSQDPLWHCAPAGQPTGSFLGGRLLGPTPRDPWTAVFPQKSQERGISLGP